MTLVAVLAYYTLFSLPPLLLIIISVVGIAFGRDVVEATIQAQIKGLIGSDVGTQIQTMLQQATRISTGVLGTALGLLALGLE